METYLAGVWMPSREAKISPFNSAVLYGETVFEAIPLFGGRPLFLSDHLRRLEKGCRFLGWRPPSHREVGRILRGFAWRHSSRGDLMVRIGLVREFEAGADPRDLSAGKIRLFAGARPLRHDPASPNPARGRIGLARWRVPSRKAYPHGFKTAFYLTSRQEMGARPDWAEMLRLDEKGAVVDGFASTPLLVQRGRVLAPPKDRSGLEGVTIGRILSVCPKLGIKVVRRPWRPDEIRPGKCELLFVGSGVGILSADRFLGKDLGPMGPVTLLLWRVYRDWVRGRAVRGGPENAN